MLKHFRDKAKARTVAGRGKKSLLGDRGSELRLRTEKKKETAKIEHGMSKKKANTERGPSNISNEDYGRCDLINKRTQQRTVRQNQQYHAACVRVGDLLEL